MSDRPILFSAPMVRALLAGTKTQTRRVVKHPGLASLSHIVDCRDGWWGDEEGDFQALCPYGAPGDRLWVRETWQHVEGGAVRDAAGGVMDSFDDEIVYRADNMNRRSAWTPSIHMPRWASRITLEITAVRVERLQDISEADAKAEGVEPMLVPPDGGSAPHVEGYRTLWESINGAGSWDANPWVWVLEFRRATT